MSPFAKPLSALYLIPVKRLLLAGFYFFCLIRTADAQIPVILRVSAAEQHDTLGCNVVRELTRLSYEAILSGKAKLWSSPALEIQITAASLLEIEKASGTSFLQQDLVYVYEYWTKNTGELRSTTSGFLFAGKNRIGEEVEYGYAEYNDLQEVFMKSRLNLNANGNYNSSMASYIQSKRYNYKFLQFAGKVINNVSDSRKIMDEFVGTSKFNVSAFSSNEVPQKMVVWTLDYITDLQQAKALNGNNLLEAIGQYLKRNQEVFYNLGGDRVLSHFNPGSWNVNRIEVRELWKKPGSEVLFDPISVLIFVNDSALNEAQYRDLIRFDISVASKNWMELIREKNFNYVIREINSQEIPRSEAFLYQKALMEGVWTYLTQYVR